MMIATANSILITGESLHPNPFALFCRCFAHLSRNSFLPKMQWIWSTGFQLLGDDNPRPDAGHLRRFRSVYGAPPEDVAIAWNLIEEDPPEGIRKNRSTKHLLWAICYCFRLSYDIQYKKIHQKRCQNMCPRRPSRKQRAQWWMQPRLKYKSDLTCI